MQEIWKDIPNYENLYQVSNLGNVKSLNYNHTNKEKLLSLKNNKQGYKFVSLSKNKEVKHKRVHSLVAKCFIENPNNYPIVNHIDGNKSNNVYSNLEWVTYSQNTRHAILHNLRKDSNMRNVKGINNKNSKKIHQYTKNGEYIKTWDCVSDAARAYCCCPCTIINVAHGRIKTVKNFHFSYNKPLTDNELFTLKNHKLNKPVLMYDSNMNLLKEYNSIKEASLENNVSMSFISNCCSNRFHSSKGIIWKLKK